MARRSLCFALLCVGLLGALALTASANHSQTDLISTGPTGGNGPKDNDFGGVSADGTHVYFTTSESLVSTDTDAATDVYERVGATTTLISTGPTGGNGAIGARFAGVSTDGSHVFFDTTEKLASTDTDSAWDVYERFGGNTVQVSTGPLGGNAGIDSFYVGSSVDGGRVFFTSYDQLTADDTDSSRKDVYERSGGTTTLLSTGPAGGSGPYGADFSRATADGSIVFFRTQESLVGTDTDASLDIYKRTGGTTTLVSVGQINGNGAYDVTYRGNSQDASRMFFDTAEQLTPSDTDTYRDSYERSGGVTTLLSTGPNGGNGPFDASMVGLSADSSKIWLETSESLVSGDADGGCEDDLGNPTQPCLDVYERTAGTTNWISTGGNGPREASFAAASYDGSRVFFHTTESLSAADTDTPIQDVYLRSGGTTTLVSGPGNGPHYATLDGISTDGARVFFHTYEQLVAADTDVWNDVYERYGGQTTLISTGPGSSGNNIAFWDGASEDGTRVFFDTNESLTPGDTDGRVDIYQASQTTPGYPRPKGASPATFALVPAYQPCMGAGNSLHGAPLAYASCTPPTEESGVLTVGSPDANLHPAASVSNVKLKAIIGAAGPPDDSNVQLFINVRDVLCRAANAACPGGVLSDYTGRVLVSFGLRLTDRYNGSPLVETGTMQDMDVEIPVQCVAQAVTTEGARCQLTTTINAFYPGAALDARRAVWQVGQVEVEDEGPNGTGFGSGCPPACGDGDETAFMRQGVFVP
jgi:hypothetical protein